MKSLASFKAALAALFSPDMVDLSEVTMIFSELLKLKSGNTEAGIYVEMFSTSCLLFDLDEPAILLVTICAARNQIKLLSVTKQIINDHKGIR